MVNHGNGQLMAIGKKRERRLEAGVYSAIWLYDMHYSSHQEGIGWKKLCCASSSDLTEAVYIHTPIP